MQAALAQVAAMGAAANATTVTTDNQQKTQQHAPATGSGGVVPKEGEPPAAVNQSMAACPADNAGEGQARAVHHKCNVRVPRA